MKWFQLHPKVKAAFAAALAVGLADGYAQVAGHYPGSSIVQLASPFVVVIAAYLKGVSGDAK